MSSPVSNTLLFRPSKKRKVYRHRADDEEDHLGGVESIDIVSSQPGSRVSAASIASPPTSHDVSDLASTHVSMSEILRLRKAHKTRFGGVEFRNSVPGTRQTSDISLVISEPVQDDIGTDEAPTTVPVRRFATQTGTVGDVDKHM